MTTNKPTKVVYISTEILTASRDDPAGAMAHFLMAAFGVTLEDAVAAVTRMIISKDVKLALMCMNAAVQIRGHVTFIPDMINPSVPEYKIFIISGTRDTTRDQFNFGALHICGHVLATWMLPTPGIAGKLATKMLKKAGSCIDPEFSQYPANEAGLTNKEIAMEWAPDSIQTTKNAYNNLSDMGKNIVIEWFKNAQKYAEDFGAKVNPKSVTAAITAATQTATKQ